MATTIETGRRTRVFGIQPSIIYSILVPSILVLLHRNVQNNPRRSYNQVRPMYSKACGYHALFGHRCTDILRGHCATEHRQNDNWERWLCDQWQCAYSPKLHNQSLYPCGKSREPYAICHREATIRCSESSTGGGWNAGAYRFVMVVTLVSAFMVALFESSPKYLHVACSMQRLKLPCMWRSHTS